MDNAGAISTVIVGINNAAGTGLQTGSARIDTSDDGGASVDPLVVSVIAIGDQ